MFDIPILYIVFNRLDTVEQTFKRIKSQQPKILYIAADGARKDKKNEVEDCKRVREYILENIDWDCDVHTKFNEENLGCKYGVASAIKWFFNEIEYGIVLEDDILPTDSFFSYCKLMLEKYKDDNTIGFISGCTFPSFLKGNEQNYFKSTVVGVWGWASWSDVIKKYDEDYASLKDKNINNIKSTFLLKSSKKAFLELSLQAANGFIDTWDYQMNDYITSNGFYTLYPKKSLIRNIGFIENSTHTLNIPSYYDDESYEMEFSKEVIPFISKVYAKKYEKTVVRSFLGKMVEKNKFMNKLYLIYKNRFKR